MNALRKWVRNGRWTIQMGETDRENTHLWGSRAVENAVSRTGERTQDLRSGVAGVGLDQVVGLWASKAAQRFTLFVHTSLKQRH